MLTVDARAKINLTLDILGKRPDQYHEVSMVMQQIELADQLKVRLSSKAEGIQLISDVPGVIRVEHNLAYKAAKLMVDRFKLTQGIHMELTKRIPVAAGLAGGSADAAAVILALNQLFSLGLDDDELCELGAQVGSDVPFCMRGGTMLATGRGEILERLADMPVCYVILAKPQISISTAWAYQNYNALSVNAHPKTTDIIECLTQGDLQNISKLLCNVLESVTMEEHAEIERLKRLMLQHGALASLMSGSGPTVFGITPDQERAAYIAEKLKGLDKTQIFLTKTVCGS
ncbi:4-(cytidine 5'-diphospho)-2-C-methyl-D-erythritol kinase [Anaerosinus massiliensis]|uniref:4-(cytidine 5'-diphospho)-2-C-methyl-D-erythritol kinase n=1 Tax=Massilibacillus massiliensis TaxID=1806837 RepID=UPI000A3DBFB7|nr:4-(cytidine 5'-diphospho)-2-C-methyl-D-erythritol kinase [Massilibacillus massiliensis]